MDVRMQHLKIRNFLGIESAEIEVAPISIIIGEQATGKSIVARLIYFFNEYFANFDELSLANNEHKSSYDKRKKAEFSQIFPSYSWEASDFVIEYSNARHSIQLTSDKGSTALNLKTSSSVASFFRTLKTEYQRFSKSFDDDPIARSRILREFRIYQEEYRLESYESALFVPAARSFYATLRDEIFSILAIDNKIDQIILQFGEFYESAKFRQDYERRRFPKRSKMIDNYFSDIVKGKLYKQDGRDWLQMDRGGTIEMSRASSGQQEATPLLIAIAQFPRPGRTLIIEEPEAHLFPSAQVSVLDFILRQAKDRETSILFTTHSPYMLSSLNNYLLRNDVGMSPSFPVSDVRAYCLKEGRSKNLVDAKQGLVSADYIDSISEEILKDFEAALEALSEPT